jgi:hypothetical protein
VCARFAARTDEESARRRAPQTALSPFTNLSSREPALAFAGVNGCSGVEAAAIRAVRSPGSDEATLQGRFLVMNVTARDAVRRLRSAPRKPHP